MGEENDAACEWLTAGSELPAAGHKGLDLGDVAGLRALWTVNDLELHRLTLFE